MPRFLTALPVFNEAAHVAGVLDEVLKVTPDILVVDDGSTDGTAELLAARTPAVRVLRHPVNRGYGAAVATAFRAALGGPWDGLVTIDCDGQHQPRLIPEFVAAAATADIVSGSRYLRAFPGDTPPPESRRRINAEITAEVNRRFGLSLTDAFCGFKAYSRRALEALCGGRGRESDAAGFAASHTAGFAVSDSTNFAVSDSTGCALPYEAGYAMPLEVWVYAAAAGLRIVELPVPLVYLDLSRSFGGALDDAATRLAYYRRVLDRAEAAVATGVTARADGTA